MKKMENKKQRHFVAAFIAVMMVASVLMVALISHAAAASRTYTTCDDFDEGTSNGVNCDVPGQLQLDTEETTLPFIWVPNSNEGTVSKYDTVTGKELGRYRTGPTSWGNPSRTTVDLDGNVWFGNRNTGTVVKIGLCENGECADTNGNGVIDTSYDTNNDGDVTGAEVLPWGQDECVLFEILLGNTGSGPRGMAVDANNDLWAGTLSLSGGNKFYHIDGSTGAIFDTIDISPYASYGALIDGNGNIWSSSLNNYVLKINPTTKSITKVNLELTSYGLGIDSSNHVFVAGWGQDKIAKINVNTLAVTYAPQYDTRCRGVAVTGDGDVWVVNSQDGDVTRLDNNLNWKATISVGAGGWGATTTGAAVDAAGKVWACNYNDGYLHRIDPATDSIDLSKKTLGISGAGIGRHYSYSDMTGIVARTVTTRVGTWDVDYDSGAADTEWATVSWNDEPEGSEPPETAITVRVRSSNDGISWSAWETTTNGGALSSTGRYLKIQTKLQILSGDVSPVLSDLTVESVEVVELCPDEYRWGDYNWEAPNVFVTRQEVHFVNNGQGDAFDVTATVTCTPVNVVASEPDVTLGDIPAGGSAWSSDTFELEIDMDNPQDPNKGFCWTVEYDDAAGVHHVIRDVAKFCGEICSDICP